MRRLDGILAINTKSRPKKADGVENKPIIPIGESKRIGIAHFW